MSDLTRGSLTKILTGEIELPLKDTGPEIGMSFVIPYEQEEELKALSKRSGVTKEEIFRIAIRDVLTNAQRLIERADSIAATQEGIQRRQIEGLDADDAFRKRRDAAHSSNESEDPDYEPPRTYSRKKPNANHH